MTYVLQNKLREILHHTKCFRVSSLLPLVLLLTRTRILQNISFENVKETDRLGGTGIGWNQR